MQCRSNLLNRKNFEEVGVVLSFHIEFVHYTRTVSLKAPSHCHITGACVLPWFISRIYFKSFFFFFFLPYKFKRRNSVQISPCCCKKCHHVLSATRKIGVLSADRSRSLVKVQSKKPEKVKSLTSVLQREHQLLTSAHLFVFTG